MTLWQGRKICRHRQGLCITCGLLVREGGSLLIFLFELGAWICVEAFDSVRSSVVDVYEIPVLAIVASDRAHIHAQSMSGTTRSRTEFCVGFCGEGK